METPEKLYLHPTAKGNVGASWLTFPLTNEDIEYIRKDAFIKKANEWLSLNMKMLMNVLDVEYNTHDIDIKDFIEDFKRYMEG